MIKKLLAFFAAFKWHYRPESMRPHMRKRAIFGVEQVQVKRAGKWIEAEYPASRYQWKPLTKKSQVAT